MKRILLKLVMGISFEILHCFLMHGMDFFRIFVFCVAFFSHYLHLDLLLFLLFSL